jgi:4-alpha-glucanotransferase
MTDRDRRKIEYVRKLLREGVNTPKWLQYQLEQTLARLESKGVSNAIR